MGNKIEFNLCNNLKLCYNELYFFVMYGGTAMKKTNDRHCNIGLIVSDIEDDFSNALTKGAMRAVRQTGDNLFIYPVKYMDLSIKGTAANPRLKYDYQYNYILSYARTRKIDLILLALSSICFRSRMEKSLQILDYIKDIPTILLCSRSDSCSSVMYNNDTGLREGIEYLINVRGCRHFCMISGLSTNEDAAEREAVFMNVLQEHGFTVMPEDVAHIRDSNVCDEDAEALIVSHPDMDAIICFNDETAIGTYNALKRHGLEPGKDVAILGFDDIPASNQMTPPLSTVRADPAMIAEKAVHMGLDILHNHDHNIRNELVDTSFVLRESASGIKENMLSNAEYRDIIEKNKAALYNIHIMDRRMNIVNRDMLMFGSSNVKYFTRLLEALKMPEIGDCYLYLFDSPVKYMPNSMWKLPARVNLMAYKVDQNVRHPSEKTKSMTIDEIYNNRFFAPDGRSYMFIDIYSRNMQYGVLLCEVPYEFFRYVEQLCFQISIAVKIMSLFAKSETALTSLEQRNLMLGDISTKDELTAILNRRGFVTEADRLLSDRRNAGKDAALFCADLNYLKQINDRYGHAEGDFALKACADTLSYVFDTSAIVSRVGGDEFAILLIAENRPLEKYIPEIKKILKENGVRDGKPYPITISLGLYRFVIHNNSDLKNIMSAADEELYKDKQQKPPFEKEL